MIPSKLYDPGLYTDLGGLGELRRQAKENAPDALRAVAKQFEGIFMQMMLKSMREANLGEGIFDSSHSQLYMDMYDKQLANDLSADNGIGLAEMMVRQLSATLAGAEGSAPPTDPHPLTAGGTDGPPAAAPLTLPARLAIRTVANEPRGAVSKAEPVTRSEGAGQAAGQTAGVTGRGATEPPIRFEGPESFVEQLWPLARSAARKLGVPPSTLLAQAALETGWGRAVIKGANGRSSYNLFNIKADTRWEGDSVSKRTLEYQDGVAVYERAPFRAYSSYRESFEDYVDFIQGQPRYRQALQNSGDPERFVEALHKAGYATDPKYADKIKSILRSDLMVEAALKYRKPGPLTGKSGEV